MSKLTDDKAWEVYITCGDSVPTFARAIEEIVAQEHENQYAELEAQDWAKYKQIAELESQLQNLQASFRVNMIRAYPEKSHDEISAGIEIVLQSQAPSHPSPLDNKELIWLYTHCRAIGMDCKSESGKIEHDMALFTSLQKDLLAELELKVKVSNKQFDDLLNLTKRLPVQVAEQVQEPMQAAFEVWAKGEGGLSIELAKSNMSTVSGRFPATYRDDSTEIAWRAWANKPAPLAAQVRDAIASAIGGWFEGEEYEMAMGLLIAAFMKLSQHSSAVLSEQWRSIFHLQRKSVLPHWENETPGHGKLEDSLKCVQYSKSTKDRPLRIVEIRQCTVMDQAAIDAALRLQSQSSEVKG